MAGVAADQVFIDRVASNAHDRPARADLLSRARPGDLVVVHSLGRFARNLCDLEAVIADLAGQGCRVRFVKEGLEFGEAIAQPLTMLHGALHALAQFEQALKRERSEEGKARGRTGGRPRRLTDVQEAELMAEASQPGANKAAIARKWGVGKRTFYRIMHRHEQ